MHFFDDQYLDILRRLLHEGASKGDRTKTGMREIFGTPQMEFDLNTGRFPLLTTKKMFTKGIIVELLWFLNGDTNIKYLQDHGVHIWDAWADENGDLGPVYGAQWRRWKHTTAEDRTDAEAKASPHGLWSVEENEIDQIADLIQEINTKPDSRRMMVSAWNPGEVSTAVLPPCHCAFQTNVQPLNEFRRKRWAQHMGWDGSVGLDEWGAPKSELHLKLYQRSADWFLGVPFNIASYSMLTMMLAQVCGLAPGRFIHTFGSAHLYENHVEQAREQLSRRPFPSPKMLINPEVKEIDGFSLEDFKVEEYQHHPTIKAPIAV